MCCINHQLSSLDTKVSNSTTQLNDIKARTIENVKLSHSIEEITTSGVKDILSNTHHNHIFAHNIHDSIVELVLATHDPAKIPLVKQKIRTTQNTSKMYQVLNGLNRSNANNVSNMYNNGGINTAILKQFTTYTKRNIPPVKPGTNIVKVVPGLAPYLRSLFSKYAANMKRL